MQQSPYLLESKLFASLANPKRLEILHLLEHDSLSVSQIVEMTGIPQANVSQHLSVLRQFRLIVSVKKGQERIYSLASNHVPIACTAIAEILAEKNLDDLELYVDPVCGMQLSERTAVASINLHHKQYYFCGQGCLKKFSKGERV